MQSFVTRNRWTLVAFICLLLALSAVDEREKQYAIAAEYCAQVHAKAWPDYKKQYRELCEDGRVRR